MALLTSPVPPPESNKTVLTNKELTVEVDVSADHTGDFKKLFGMRTVSAPLDSDMIDITTYDDGKFKSQMPGDISWSVTATVLLALYKQGAGVAQDPALVKLRSAHQNQELVHVRWYRRNAQIDNGYEGYGYCKYTENGGPKQDPTEVQVEITGAGERFEIENPFNATPPTPAAWAASTDYAYGDVVTVAGGTLRATEDGTSGATEPTAPATVGGTVVDSTVEWTRTA